MPTHDRAAPESSADARIRVALLAPGLHPGGAERQMLMLASALPKDTFDVRFILLWERGALASDAEALGLRVHVLGLGRESCRGLSPRCFRDAAYALRSYRRLTRDVDIVDAWLVPAYTFAGVVRPLARVPILLAGRRSTFDVARTRIWFREIAGRIAMRSVDAVVANSQAGADDVIRHEGIDATRVHVIRNAVSPIDTSSTDRDGIRAAWGLSESDVVVGCVGNFKPGKGHDLLIETAADLRARHPDLRYCFVGDGALRDQLEAEIARRGLADIVTLRSGERDARRLYSAFDIAVQASDSEGLPNVVLEAAAAGLPIVATAVGGTGEILTSEVDGILVPRGDRGALSDAIARLAEDPALRERLGRAALARSEAFSVARLAEQTGALYQRLVASLNGRARRGGRRRGSRAGR